MCFESAHNRNKQNLSSWTDSTCVVPINQITIGHSRLLGNFVTIGIGKFQGCSISLLKSNDIITLYVKLSQVFVVNLLILTAILQFCKFYCMFVIIDIRLKC